MLMLLDAGEQELEVKDQGLFKSRKRRTFFLFNDLLMWTSTTSHTMKGTVDASELICS
jgi:hypothetical protein